MTIFLGGISIHVRQALVWHLIGIEMTWGSTAKEVEQSILFEEIGKVARNFKFTFIYCILSIIAMIYFAQFDPMGWKITSVVLRWLFATLIVSHLFLPIALNPGLMLVKW